MPGGGGGLPSPGRLGQRATARSPQRRFRVRVDLARCPGGALPRPGAIPRRTARRAAPGRPRRVELPDGSRAVDVCCLTGEGIEALKDAIRELAWGGEIHAEMLEVTINARHQNALQRAQQALERATAALRENLGLELVALELRIAADAVGEIVGKTSTALSTRK